MKFFIPALATFLFAFSALAVEPLPADLQTPPPTADQSDDLINPLLVITGPYVGYRFQYFDYVEPSPDIHQFGALNGAVVGYDGIIRGNDFFYKAELEYLTGTLSYNGYYQGGGALEADTNDHTALLRFNIGFTTYQTTNTALQFYSGLTSRYLYDYVQASGGYRREISQVTLPLGIIRRQAFNHWAYGLMGEIDILVSGVVRSHLSDVGPSYTDIENKQSRGFGARVGAEFDIPINSMTLMIQPTFQYWVRDDSDIDTTSQGSYLEPHNTTKIYNLSVSLKF